MTGRTLVSPPAVHWVQDAGQVLVVNEDTGSAVSLPGFEAAVWKWFSLSYNHADVLAFLREAIDRPEEEARLLLDQCITRWVGLGLLVQEGAR